MTPRQADTLTFIKAFIAENGYSPSMREIAAGIGVASVRAAHGHVGELEKLGVLRVRRAARRGIELIADETEFHLLAILADVASSGCVTSRDTTVREAVAFMKTRVPA